MTPISVTGARHGIRGAEIAVRRRSGGWCSRGGGKGRPSGEAENERLRRRLAKAEVKLEQTRAALDIMGKAFALLEMLSERADSPKPSAR